MNSQSLIIVFLLVGLRFEARASHLQSSALPLELHLQPILVFLEMRSHELFAWAGLEL
jgi:hypothetical protein